MSTINNKHLLNLFKCTSLRRSNSHSRSKSNLHRILFSMPLEKNHMDAMREQRVRLKEKGRKYLPGTLYLQVLGSGAAGSSGSLYLFSDQTRYLFNCSEGTQRLALEHKCKLAKLEHIFITRPTWENIGGLPGLSLSAQDVGVPHLTLHGPEGISEIFRATVKFVILRSLSVSMFDCDSNEVFEDSILTVRYVKLTKKTSESEKESDSDHSIVTSDDETDYYAHEKDRSAKRLRLANNLAPKSKKSKASCTRISDTIAYICKLKPRLGTLCLEKCVQKGVPPGPLLGLLKNGTDVKLPNGDIVYSADVRLQDDPGAVFIVLECPTIEYLDSLIENKEFENYQRSGASDADLAYCVVHFTPHEVMQDPRYKSWMDKFALGTTHLVLNKDNNCFGSESVFKMQHQLHLLHPKIFPLLNAKGLPISEESAVNVVEKGKKDDDRPTESCSQLESLNDVESEGNSIIIRGKTLQTIHLRPKKGLDRNLELKLDPKSYINEAMANERFLDALAELQTEINSKTKELGEIAEYPKVIFFGTGSCAPNKNRNTSGILIRISETSSIVLDCGEGTLTQIMRYYGKSEAYKVLESIKAIYVSHLHADHHMGLIGLLKARKWVTEDSVYVLAPKQLSSWLYSYHKRFEPILDKITLIKNHDLTIDDDRDTSIEKKMNKVYSDLGVKDISTVLVKHVPNSFGVAVTLENGYKVTYSGDTMPCMELVELGRNSDLLIHEATMEDELESEARSKLHSTTSQAIEVGRKMNAKFTLLTHFSQRYAKIPILPEDVEQNVGIAFDNMEVRFEELSILPLLYPTLKLMFAEAYEELDNRATRRKLRLQQNTN